MQSWEDLEVSFSTEKRKYSGRLYGDRLEIPELKLIIEREDILSYLKFFSHLRVKVRNAKTVRTLVIRSANYADLKTARKSMSRVMQWLDPLNRQKFLLSFATFISATALGAWKPGWQFWPLILSFAVVSVIALRWFFTLTDKSYSQQIIQAGAALLILGIPVSLIIPNLILVFAGIAAAFIILFPILVYRQRPEMWSRSFLAGIWLVTVLLIWQATILGLQTYSDYQRSKFEDLPDKYIVRNENTIKTGNLQIEIPKEWEIRDYPFFARYIFDDICASLPVVKPRFRVNFPNGGGGWLAFTRSNSGQIAQTFEKMVRDPANNSWALYFGGGKPVTGKEKHFEWLSINHVFFKAKGASKIVMAHLMLTPQNAEMQIVFCYEPSGSTVPDYYRQRFLDSIQNSYGFP